MPIEIWYRMHIPEYFLDKENYEDAVIALLDKTFGSLQARRGDPLLQEPDFVTANGGLEVAFVSSNEKDSHFAKDFCDGCYVPGRQHNRQLQHIIHELECKKKKSYRVQPVSVAVFCMLELFSWADGCEFRKSRDAFLARIRERYGEVFHTVYLIVPTLDQSWMVFDVMQSKSETIRPVEEEVNFPFYLQLRLDMHT